MLLYFHEVRHEFTVSVRHDRQYEDGLFVFYVLSETLLRSVFMELEHRKAWQLSQRNSFLNFPNRRIPSLVHFSEKKVGSFPK